MSRISSAASATTLVDHRVPRRLGDRRLGPPRLGRAPARRLLHGQGHEPVPLGGRPRPQGKGPYPLVCGQQLEVAGDDQAPTRVVEVAAFVHPEARPALLDRRPPQPCVARAHHDPVAVQHEVDRAHRRRVVLTRQRDVPQAAPFQQAQALRPREHLEAGLVDDRSVAHHVRSTARAGPGEGAKVPPLSGQRINLPRSSPRPPTAPDGSSRAPTRLGLGRPRPAHPPRLYRHLTRRQLYTAPATGRSSASDPAHSRRARNDRLT